MHSSYARSKTEDGCTQSNFNEHLSFDWFVDWDKQLVTGSVTHRVVANEDGVDKVVLDTSYLDIHKVYVEGKAVKWELADRHAVKGSALTIRLPTPMAASTQRLITIYYSTTSQCTALGWLEKAQTESKRLPFTYSQSQAIHARSLFPCADTPAIKITWDATVRSSLPEATVLLSARRISPPLDHAPSATEQTVFRYNQPIAIPSYLVAIVAGDLKYAPLGPRSGVWADPTQLAACVKDFERDTERFLAIGESIATPYDWGTYDVCVLPKSFPYGGMEDPNLTLLTPTLLTGDASLVDVVAHEASHSWTGNLVGCMSWTHFWLNEGWTTYLENLIIGHRHGMAHRDFQYVIGRGGLRKALQEQSKVPKYQQLVIPYDAGEDPDDGFSRVPYEKGSHLLLHIERTVGGIDVFGPYTKDYIRTFAGKSIETQQWQNHLYDYFRKHHGQSAIAKLDSIDWDTWLYGQGSDLPVDMKYDTSLADAAYSLASRWSSSLSTNTYDAFSRTDLADFNTYQVVLFIETLEAIDNPTPAFLAALSEKYGFDTTSNAEVRSGWYDLALKTEAGRAFTMSAAEWVKDKGRMKYCRPCLKLLYALDPELARSTFLSAASFYHPIARAMLKKDLGL